MATVDSFRRLADKCRAIPAAFGLREYAVYLVRKTWTGAIPGDGDQIQDLIPLTVGNGQNPKVRFPSQRDVAIGNMSLGEILIGPLTPDYGSGGIIRDNFSGLGMMTGQGQVVRVYAPSGDDSSDYKVNYVNTDHALRVTLKCTNLMISGE